MSFGDVGVLGALSALGMDNIDSVTGIGNLTWISRVPSVLQLFCKNTTKMVKFLTELKEYLPNKSTCALLNRRMLHTRPSSNSLSWQ